MIADDLVEAVCTTIAAIGNGLPVADRVTAYNAIQEALGHMVADFAPDPACSPRLLPAERVRANDYNPNKVAAPELDLLEASMRADGITMAVVAMPQGDGWVVVDGFHRRTVATSRLGRAYIPSALLDKPTADRMASTVRHNRARGKHQVELMGELVKGMLALGWSDERVAESMGMSVEELLRLKQTVGVAALLAAPEYNRAWKDRDGEDPVDAA